MCQPSESRLHENPDSLETMKIFRMMDRISVVVAKISCYEIILKGDQKSEMESIITAGKSLHVHYTSAPNRSINQILLVFIINRVCRSVYR